MNKDKGRIPTSEREPGDDAISALYHVSSIAEPPEQLDEAILTASRRGVKSNTRAIGPFSGRWQIPASMAAVLIIVIVLVPLLKHQSRVPRTIPEPTPRRDEPLATGKDTGPESEHRTPPASSSSVHDELESIAPPAPGHTLPGKAELRSYSKELRSLSEDFIFQERASTAGTDDKNILPAQWLARIHHLREAGHTEKAKAQLRRFLARYPDYPIDPPLRELLPEPQH